MWARSPPTAHPPLGRAELGDARASAASKRRERAPRFGAVATAPQSRTTAPSAGRRRLRRTSGRASGRWTAPLSLRARTASLRTGRSDPARAGRRSGARPSGAPAATPLPTPGRRPRREGLPGPPMSGHPWSTAEGTSGSSASPFSWASSVSGPGRERRRAPATPGPSRGRSKPHSWPRLGADSPSALAFPPFPPAPARPRGGEIRTPAAKS